MSAMRSRPAVPNALLEGDDLSVSDAAWCMEQVMTGAATDAQLAAFLIALRLKGETVDEIVGFRDAILEHAVELPVDPWRSTSSARRRSLRHRERLDDTLA